MKIYISYFYHIRQFPKNLLPVSTAIWDPKWYHENLGNWHTFTDKRGILNGLRVEELAPKDIPEEEICTKGCTKDYKTCGFLKCYRERINSIDFDALMQKLQKMADSAKTPDNPDIDICLMVYETPTNPCSERVPIIELFASHGITVEEFVKPE